MFLLDSNVNLKKSLNHNAQSSIILAKLGAGSSLKLAQRIKLKKKKTNAHLAKSNVSQDAESSSKHALRIKFLKKLLMTVPAHLSTISVKKDAESSLKLALKINLKKNQMLFQPQLSQSVLKASLCAKELVFHTGQIAMLSLRITMEEKFLKRNVLLSFASPAITLALTSGKNANEF